MATKISRKIAVILATDVVGYSKHMEENENEAVQTLRSCEKIFTQCLKKHEGKIFNTGGDSFFAEFKSAVSAVECGVEFQRKLENFREKNELQIDLKFRIGINMGDVVLEKKNLLGDGVNIAARLESLCQPNGISVSKSIYDLVNSKLKLPFIDLGIQKVKNNEYKIEKSNLDIIQKDFISESCDENETLEIIKQHFDKSSVILDPHTAVGVGASNKLNFSDCVVLSTAHPCKFPAATDKAINKHEELPKELQYVHSKEENFQLLKNDTEEVKNFVKSKL